MRVRPFSFQSVSNFAKSNFPALFFALFRVRAALTYSSKERMLKKALAVKADKTAENFELIYQSSRFLINRGVMQDSTPELERAYKLQKRILMLGMEYHAGFLKDFLSTSMMLGQLDEANRLFDFLWKNKKVYEDWMVKIAFDLNKQDYIYECNKVLHKNYYLLSKKHLKSYNKLFVQEERVTQEPYTYFKSGKAETFVPSKNVAKLNHYLAELTGAMVDPRYSIFENNGYVVYETGVDPSRGFNAGLWDYSYGSHHNLNNVLLYSKATKLKKLRIKKGIHLFGRINQNIFHFLLEYLPRMRLIVESGLPLSDYKIIIPESMYFQFYELIKSVIPNEFEFHVMAMDTLLSVDSLIVPTVNTSLDDTQNEELSNCGIYSGLSLGFLKDRLKSLIWDAEKNFEVPECVYLSRKSGAARGMANEKEIRKCLKKRGFVPLDPGSLSISQQIAVFRKAKCIVGVAGAAFSLTFMASKRVKIVSFVAAGNEGYAIQPRLAHFAGCEHIFVCGKKVVDNVHYETKQAAFHADFTIELKQLKKALGEI